MKNVYVEHYDHATNAWEEFGIRNLGEYYDLYGQSDTLLLAEVFDIFRSRCIKIYKLYPTHFYSTRVSVVSSIKKQRRVGTNWHWHLINNRGIKGKISNAIHQYATSNKKYTKGYKFITKIKNF